MGGNIELNLRTRLSHSGFHLLYIELGFDPYFQTSGTAGQSTDVSKPEINYLLKT